MAAWTEAGARPAASPSPDTPDRGSDVACHPRLRYVARSMTRSDRLDLLDPLDVSRLGGIEVTTEGVVEGFLTGLHRSPRRGF